MKISFQNNMMIILECICMNLDTLLEVQKGLYVSLLILILRFFIHYVSKFIQIIFFNLKLYQ